MTFARPRPRPETHAATTVAIKLEPLSADGVMAASAVTAAGSGVAAVATEQPPVKRRRVRSEQRLAGADGVTVAAGGSARASSAAAVMTFSDLKTQMLLTVQRVCVLQWNDPPPPNKVLTLSWRVGVHTGLSYPL